MDNESNNSLYFIVGGLVVLAAIFGFVYLADNNNISDGLANVSPAAGERAVEDNTSEMRTELQIDEDGASATTTKND